MALDIGNLGLWEHDLITDELTANPTCRAVLDLPTSGPITYQQLESRLPPDDVERLKHAISYALKTKTDFNLAHRVLRSDGRIGRVLVRGRAIFENGEPVRMIGVNQDIIEREKAKQEVSLAQKRQDFLLGLNDQLRSLNDPDGIMDASTRSLGKFFDVDFVGYGEVNENLGVNVVAREWTRGALNNEGRAYRLQEFYPEMLSMLQRGETVYTNDCLTDPRLADPQLQAIYRTINARTALAVPLLKDGQLSALLYMNAAKPQEWSGDDLALITDVAERTWIAIGKARAEVGLRATEARLHTISETLPALVWILNPDLEMTYTNARWTQYSGMSAEQALGQGWRSIIHPDDIAKIVEGVKDVHGKEALFMAEARHKSASGAYRWHLIQAAPFHDASGTLQGWCGMSVDIHDLKKTEEALRVN